MAIKAKMERVFEKARPHKYIRRVGAPKAYRYIYDVETDAPYGTGDPARYHQTKIARDTLKMSDAMVGVMGGPSKAEARDFLGLAADGTEDHRPGAAKNKPQFPLGVKPVSIVDKIKESKHPKMVVKDPDRVSLASDAYGSDLHEPTMREVDHEEMRIGSMSEKALHARIYKITDPQKMYAFARALENENYHNLAGDAYNELANMGWDTHGRLQVTPAQKKLLQAAAKAKKEGKTLVMKEKKGGIKASKWNKTINAILEEAQMSEPLRDAMVELREAIASGNMDEAYEISSVKSFISGKVVTPKVGNMFSEDSAFNEEKLGTDVYGLIDSIHHEIAFEQNKLPSGMMVIGGGQIQQKGAPKGKSKTIGLLIMEHAQTLKDVAGMVKKPKKVPKLMPIFKEAEKEVAEEVKPLPIGSKLVGGEWKEPKAKNLASKTRPVENPYEVWKSPDGSWEWRVLKKYQAPDKEKTNPYARWYTAVKSPFTMGSWAYGDTYVKDVTINATKVQSGDFRNAEPPAKPKLPKGEARRIDIGQDEYEKSFTLEEPFLKARTKGAKDKKKRKKRDIWDYPEGKYPTAVKNAVVHQVAKDWGVPKSAVRKQLKEKMAEIYKKHKRNWFVE